MSKGHSGQNQLWELVRFHLRTDWSDRTDRTNGQRPLIELWYLCNSSLWCYIDNYIIIE